MANILGKIGSILSLPVLAPIKLVTGTVTKQVENIINGQVRHILSGAAGYLVAHGLLSGSDSTAFIGLLMQVVAMILSAAEKQAGV